MKSFLYGGGGAGLSYAVKSFATEAALDADTPAENTIGIVTETEIGRYAFSSTEPTTIDGTAVAEGDVYIQIAARSAAPFNALKKNTLNVYPLRCYQYVSDAWVLKTAKCYQNSAWTTFVVYLYNRGDEMLAFTGGWERGSYGVLTKNASSIKISCANAPGNLCSVWTVGAVDLTDIEQIDINVMGYGVSYASNVMRIAQTQQGTPITATQITGTGTFSTDVSQLDGSYYIGVGVAGSTTADKYFIEFDEVNGE